MSVLASNEIIDRKKLYLLLVAFQFLLLLTFYKLGPVNAGFLFLAAFLPLFFLSFLAYPIIGILLMVFATGLQGIGKFGNVSVFHLVFLFTLFGYFTNGVIKDRIEIPKISLWIPFILLSFLHVISLIYTPDFATGSVNSLRFIAMGFVAVVTINLVENKNKANLVVWTIIFSSALMGMYSIYQMITGDLTDPLLGRIRSSYGIPVVRASGTFDDSNFLGQFQMIGIIFGLGKMVSSQTSKKTKLVVLGLIGFSIAGLIVSFSRNAWLGATIGFLFIVVVNRKWSYLLISLVVTTSLLAFLSYKNPVIARVVTDRLVTIFDPKSEISASSRIAFVKSGIKMWKDHPFWGVGIDGFHVHYYDYIDPSAPWDLSGDVNGPHNIHTKYLAEQGIIGYVVLLWLLFEIIYRGLMFSRKSNDGFTKNLGITCVASILSFIVCFTFVPDIHHNLFWITIGLIYSIPQYANSKF